MFVFCPLGYVVFIIPIAQQVSKAIHSAYEKVMVLKDSRVKLMCEVLFGIRIIKYYAWEKHFGM